MKCPLPIYVWPVALELSVEKIFIAMYLLAHVDPFSAPPDLGQQIVLLHYSQNRFGISADAAGCQRELHSSVSIGAPAFLLLSTYCLRQICIPVRLAQAMNERVVSASGNAEKLTHDGHRVLLPMTIDNSILYRRPHILSVHCRKSRSNSFSILSRLFSYLYS